MYAVIRTGGKQYKVAKDDVIVVRRACRGGRHGTLGGCCWWPGVATTVGTPTVSGAEVTAWSSTSRRQGLDLQEAAAPQLRRKIGHRQP
jgi:large subunit ribosomal protein L21